jgi:hypothetical protein
MIDLAMIGPKAKVAWLMLISLFFVASGSILIWYMLRSAFVGNSCVADQGSVADGERLQGYKEGFDCTCVKGKIVCTEVVQSEVDNDLQIEDFRRDNLDFEARYVTAGASDEVAFAPLGTVFRGVSSRTDSVEVILEQSQMCTADMEAPVQIGMYHASKNSLTLLLIVNTVASVYTQPCTVRTTFNISDIDLDPKSGYRLRYRNEGGEVVSANVCVYNDGLFNNGDKYEAEDACNICTCDNGISRCTNDRVCSGPLQDDTKENPK